MAKRSKSKFTDLVKFIPDPDDTVYDQEENNEIRTNRLDSKYGDDYDDYDEYDEYREDASDEFVDEEVVVSNVEDTPVEIETVQETVEEIPDEAPEEIEVPDEEIPESAYEEEVSDVVDVAEPEDTDNIDDTEDGNVIIDVESLQNVNEYNNRKVENNMKREVPDFIKEEDINIQKPQVGSQRYNQQQTAVVEPTNLKESIILGNTTIKGDVITDTGIQIYGAVIGNIESGGRVQLMGKVEGDISGQSVVITNTSLNGNIHAEDDVFIKQGCVVNGDVSGAKVVLNGTVKGNIEATGQVDFEAGSAIEGNVSAHSFNIRPGAKINGSISTL